MDKLHFTPVHPGAVLMDELEEIGLTQSSLAKHVGVLPQSTKYAEAKGASVPKWQ